ncbi:MAG TPA: O-antigen ligase family protein [Hyphomicrobium sp.]|nr:O-antigen ligase family protein [Hyphomicrobium sp.]
MSSQLIESKLCNDQGQIAWQLAILGVIVAILPVLVFAREASPLLCVLLLVTLVGASYARGDTDEALVTLRRWLGRPEAHVLIAALALLSLSVMWSPATEHGAVHAFRVVIAALLIAALLAFGSITRLKSLRLALALSLATGAALLIANLLVDDETRRWIGLSPDLWRMNRAAVAIVLFAPISLVLLWRSSRMSAVGLAGLCLPAVFLSFSESAQFAALVAAAVWTASALNPIVIHRIVGTAMVTALLAMPFVVRYANELVPAAIHEKVGYGTLTIRGEIWTAFADLIPERPLLGYGIDASNIIAKTPIAAGLPENVRELLALTHPHNAPLQVWFELGFIGALFAALLAIFALRAIERLPVERLGAATATAAAAFTISSVSHGAWQSWWFCLIGLVAATYAMLPTRPADDNGLSRTISS